MSISKDLDFLGSEAQKNEGLKFQTSSTLVLPPGSVGLLSRLITVMMGHQIQRRTEHFVHGPSCGPIDESQSLKTLHKDSFPPSYLLH